MSNWVSGVLPGPRHGAMLATAGLPYNAPARIDHRSELLPASNQGTTSMCVAYTLAGMIEYWRWRLKGDDRQVDPEPIYAKAKEIDEYPGQEGTTLSAGFAACESLGLIRSAEVRHFEDPLYANRALHRYGVVPIVLHIREGFERADSAGWVTDTGKRIGHHAVLLCAYSADPGDAWYGVQNSWSPAYGWRGYCRMSPAAFIDQFSYGLAADLSGALQDSNQVPQ